MTTTTADATTTTTTITKAPPKACTNCGEPYPESLTGGDAQKRMADLESQVRILTEKASTAVDKLADYEDELRRLREAQARRDSEATTSDSVTTASTTAAPAPVAAAPAATSALYSALGFGRKTPSPAPQTAAGATASTATSSAKEAELSAALAKEQDLRKKAEGKATSLSAEMEELSVQLFQQANEMVAVERRARAKLEERVKILEMREEEKRTRLERLEKAVKRADRIRGLLAAG